MTEKVRYIVFRGQVLSLVEKTPGFWYDIHGTLYAFRDAASSVDESDNCGIGAAKLPDWGIFKRINDGCGPHDYMYSSPVFQAFHSRAEADDWLEKLQTLGGHPLIGQLMEDLATRYGAEYWENPKTRTT